MSLAMSFQVNRAEFQLQVSLELPDQGVTALFGRQDQVKPPCYAVLQAWNSYPVAR